MRRWVKACEGVALVAFFLPWMTVSCSGTEIARASGWDLAVGHPRLSPALANMAQGAAQAPQTGGHASIWLILALVAIVAGLIAAFRPAPGGTKVVIAKAVAAIILVLIGTRNISNEALAKASAARGDDHGFAGMAVAAIRIDWLFAYWLTLLALAAAAVLSWMTLTGRSFPARGGVGQSPPV